uniref:Uncharacterized protein n=1 Tax=Amphimedon queenslandica TaxID=400682 RepID=A0A1X7UEX4_AMPQE
MERLETILKSYLKKPGESILGRLWIIFSYRYFEGGHKPYGYCYGTLPFTSIDAHRANPSRRGDLEILGYWLLQWSSLCVFIE